MFAKHSSSFGQIAPWWELVHYKFVIVPSISIRVNFLYEIEKPLLKMIVIYVGKFLYIFVDTFAN